LLVPLLHLGRPAKDKERKRHAREFSECPQMTELKCRRGVGILDSFGERDSERKLLFKDGEVLQHRKQRPAAARIVHPHRAHAGEFFDEVVRMDLSALEGDYASAAEPLVEGAQMTVWSDVGAVVEGFNRGRRGDGTPKGTDAGRKVRPRRGGCVEQLGRLGRDVPNDVTWHESKWRTHLLLDVAVSSKETRCM
jgi:hypothetical protein